MRQHVEDSFDYQLPSLLQRHSARYFCKSLESVFEVSFFLLFVSFLSQNLDTLKNWRIIVRRCMIIGKFKLTGRLQGGQPAPQTPPTSGSAAYTASGGGFNDVLNRWGCLLNWLVFLFKFNFFVYFCILTLASLKSTPIPHGVETSMMSPAGEYILSVWYSCLNFHMYIFILYIFIPSSPCWMCIFL